MGKEYQRETHPKSLTPTCKQESRVRMKNEVEEFLNVKKKMDSNINVNSQDLEDIYYKNSSAQILAGVQKKQKIYVVSNSLDLPTGIQFKLEQELSQLSGAYMTRWITGDCLRASSDSKRPPKFQKAGSLFDIGVQQLNLHSLYSKTSYFILMQVKIALQMQQMLDNISCCLYISSDKYDEVIDNLPRLSNLSLICFDSPEANKAFYQHLMSKSQQKGNQDIQIDFLSLSALSVESIVYQLQKLKERQTCSMQSLQSVRQSQIPGIIAEVNSITVVDSDLIEDMIDLFDNTTLNLADKHSMLLIVCEEQIPEVFLKKSQPKNWIYIYSDFQKINIKNKQYFPVRSFREVIDLIQLKSRVYKQSIGGTVVLRQNSIIYTLPADKLQQASKVQAECAKVVKRFSFVKVTRKGSRVKVSWNLSKEARLIRTICQLKYASHGVLGNFNLISRRCSFRDLKDQIKYIMECQPNIFAKGSETFINQYQFGSKIGGSRFRQEENQIIEINQQVALDGTPNIPIKGMVSPLQKVSQFINLT